MQLAHPSDTELGTLPKDVGVPAGGAAPAATVSDADGKPVKLDDLVASGPVLFIFYRGGWCPFCNLQIRGLTRDFPEFQKRGVTPVAISVDRPEAASKTRATYEIPFPVLSDPDLAAHKAYRVLQQVDAETFTKLKGMGLDIEAASGRDHHTIAVPALFLVDKAGVVRWAHAALDYKQRPSNEQIFKAIDASLPAKKP